MEVRTLPYSFRVTKRSITLLFAALLALCGVTAAPVARAQRLESCPVVWIAAERSEARVTTEPPSPAAPPERLHPLPDEPRAVTATFSPFLYGRPPPALA